MKISISVNTSWNIFNFRYGLLKSLISDGHEIIAISPFDEYSSILKDMGCRYISIPMDNTGINPIKDFLLFLRYLIIFIKVRPDVFLSFTIKPNIYGSIASRLLKIATINNITGLGTVFVKESYVTKIVEFLYRISLRRSYCIFFQNNDDLKLFISRKLVNSSFSKNSPTLQLLPGSGIDLDYFKDDFNNQYKTNQLINKSDKVKFTNTKCSNQQCFNFLFIGRIIKDKGINEFISAARMIKLEKSFVNFRILGSIDSRNSGALEIDIIENWISEGLVDFLGETSDVRAHIAQSDCVVLPSYREGTPRSLLEAAAMNKPIIASDVVGCREVVDDEENGFLCKPYDSLDLFYKMKKMIELGASDREIMGIKGRKKMEEFFDEKIVIEKYKNVISKIYS